MDQIPISTDGAPAASGTYTQAIRTGDLVFVACQIGRDPITEKLPEGIDAQTRQVLANIEAVLTEAGCTKADIVKVTMIFSGLKYFKPADDIYVQWLPGRDVAPWPVRTAFAAAGLPEGAFLMMDVIAVSPAK